MGLYVVADLGSLRDAAGQLGAAVDPGGKPDQQLSLGDAGADEALGQFASAMGTYTTGLAGAAQRGVSSLHGYALSFQQAGG